MILIYYVNPSVSLSVRHTPSAVGYGVIKGVGSEPDKNSWSPISFVAQGIRSIRQRDFPGTTKHNMQEPQGI